MSNIPRLRQHAAILLAACVTFASIPAQALDSKHRYLILGPGSDSCSTVLTNLEEGVKRKSQAAVIVYSNWLAGSLTAYNRDTANTYSILGELTFKEALEWTLDYCHEHPDHIFAAATDAFIKEYREDRYTVMPRQ